MDEEKIFQGISYALSGVFASVVIVWGLTGNALSFVVLLQPQMRSPMSTFLSIQVVWDTFTRDIISGNLASPLSILPGLLSSVCYHLRLPCVDDCSNVLYLDDRGLNSNAVYRRLPSAEGENDVHNLARKGNAFVYYMLVFNMVRWLELKIDDKNTRNESQTVQIIESDFGNSPFMREVYSRYMYPIVMSLLPFLILATLSILIYTAVKRSDKQRTLLAANQQSRPATRSNNATKMPLFVLVVIIICQLPTLVYNVEYSINTSINEELGWRVLSEVRIVLVTLNSAINVLVYGAMGRKFRHAFKCTFTCNHDTRRYTRWIYHPVGSNLSPSASLDNSPLSIALRAFRFEVPGQGQLNVTVECP
ncbi:LOW QUALITY PROTEIN: FMAR-like protein [Mya arenaria]|uniref:FMAR-like protein n=1 Tax=Mya arenaria TaxID=6604 RepID=A0ABY7E7H7_MYAAR|nr:LOW QUALITY PROTEIN: FMAR-like protein [Mya arenaria]